MSETKQYKISLRGARRYAQAGSVAIEFSLIAIWFFMLIFGIMEIARLMYMYNTLAEVTRSAAKAASNIDFHNTAALNSARKRAIFGSPSGELVVGKPITIQNIRIDYMFLERQGNGSLLMKPIATASLPACPSRNRHNCLENPYSSSCIRLVRVRVCREGNDDCDRVPYEPIFPLVPLGVSLPDSTTIVKAETLGYSAGDALCP
jgi:hypothetical protein